MIIASLVIMTFPHAKSRINSYVASLKNSETVNSQVYQAKIALGSGGWFGVGLGKSRQRIFIYLKLMAIYIFNFR